MKVKVKVESIGSMVQGTNQMTKHLSSILKPLSPGKFGNVQFYKQNQYT